jgi:hypothetical protein
MITTTWTKAPADLLGLGGSVLRACAARDSVMGATPAMPAAPFQGSGVPAGGIAVRLRPAVRTQAQYAPFAHNSIGTTLGNCSSRRPQS